MFDVPWHSGVTQRYYVVFLLLIIAAKQESFPCARQGAADSKKNSKARHLLSSEKCLPLSISSMLSIVPVPSLTTQQHHNPTTPQHHNTTSPQLHVDEYDKATNGSVTARTA
jgi:hypothetical protein